jgi:hypothetical protein
MFRKVTLIAGVGLVMSAAAQAQNSYRWEVNADYRDGDVDTGTSGSGFFDIDDLDLQEFALSGSYYMDLVDTNKGPRSEAAFLDHASDITLHYIYSDLDGHFLLDQETDQFGVSGRFVTDRAGWIFEGTYDRLDFDEGGDADIFSLGFGKYLTENLSLVGSYVDFDDDGDGYNAALEWFLDLASGGIKLDANVGTIDVDEGDDIDVYNLTGVWYLTDDLGIGAGWGNFHNQDNVFFTEVERINLFAEWFFAPGVALSLGYREDEVDDTDIEIDVFEVGATLRF